MTETDKPSINPPLLLTSYILHQFSQHSTTHSATASSLDPSSSHSITTLYIDNFPSLNLCAISPLHDSFIPDTVMAALQISQSLEIRCPCINGVVGSHTNCGRLHRNGPISWSLQNLFTYPTLSSLFNILHPSNTPFMQTLQDFNSDPT